MRNNLVYFIAALIIIKSFLWLFAIPIFQSPDEANHFAYVQRVAETGNRSDPRNVKIVSSELLKVARILNFNWGKSHPVWQEYQENWQEKIEEIPFNDRKEFIPKTSLPSGISRSYKNPPLYYSLAACFYRFFYLANFLYRFFTVRFFSLLISLFTVFLAYRIGILLFGEKGKLMAISLATLVAFQPSFSFMTASINNDVLLIFLATVFIYFGLKVIKEEKKELLFFAFLTIIFGLFVKPQFLIFLFIFPLLWRKKAKRGVLVTLVTFFTILIIAYFFFGILERMVVKQGRCPAFLNRLRFQVAFGQYLDLFSFFFSQIRNGQVFKQISSYFSSTKEFYLNNLFPWYWGVFGWLEVTMPLVVYRILKIICGLGIIGLARWFYLYFKRRKTFQFRSAVFLLATILIYFLGLVFNDFKVFVDTGKAFGLQGRYFIPIITAQMALLLLGLKTLVPEKFEKILSLFLIAGSIALNAVGFWTMYSYFYL